MSSSMNITDGEPVVPPRVGHRGTTLEVLTSFDNEFTEFAAAVARGEYVLWLGSGLSRSVVPDVKQLLRRILSFLQCRIDPENAGCAFRRALLEILIIAGISVEARSALDIAEPVEQWVGANDLVDRLADKYSTVLDVSVEGEDEDYLLWEAVEVRTTYGADSLEPDAEHLCLGILILEGAVSTAATANWDGLVEAALARLGGSVKSVLRVVVGRGEFRLPGARCDLIKFHGCAVKAARDPDTYRPLLVARETQISQWTTHPENAVMRDYLVHLFATKPALVIGLSAQDANIHTILGQAEKNLSWTWPASPPAVAFAVESLDYHQKRFLRLIYGGSYRANRAAIETSAQLGVYAKPLLLGLVLFTLAEKLCLLLCSLPGGSDADAERMRQGVYAIRDTIGAASGPDFLGFTGRLGEAVSFVLSTFRTGSPSMPDSGGYEPLTAQPIDQAEDDPNVDTDALRLFAVAVSLLGRGLVEGVWDLAIGVSDRISEGVCTLSAAGAGASHVFVVQDAGVLSTLEVSEAVNMNDPKVLAIHAKEIPRRQSRSPKVTYGRTGRTKAREVSIETLVALTRDADGLFSSFRREAAV